MSADAQGIRQEIDERLRARSDRILIVIDDMDRLPAAEIRQVFQLVKAVADFPRTIYLLAYDHALISDALSQEQLGSGSEYLAKIVQAPFDLPPAPRLALDQLLFDQLDQLLEGVSSDLFDQVAWGNLYVEGIQTFIRTPRDVKRLMNAIRPAYPPVRGEVSAHEFIALQAIRAFAPMLFSELALSRDLLAGDISQSQYGSELRDDWMPRCEALLSLAPENWRAACDALLRRLFPRWEYAFGGSSYGSDWLSRWRREGRACSPDVFDLYFRLALPDETIGLVEYRSLIDMASNPEELTARLRQMRDVTLQDGRTRSRVFLEGIQDFTEDGIPDEVIPGMMLAIWAAGDDLLIASDGRGMFNVDNSMQVIRITHQLLRRVSTSEERLAILLPAIEQRGAVELATREVSIRYQGLDEHQASADNLLDRDHVDQLRDVVLDQIRDAAETGSLLELDGLGYMLYRWEEWEPGAAKRYAQALGGDVPGFVQIVMAFASETYSAGLSDHVTRSRWRVSLDDIETFLEMSESEIQARAQETLLDPSAQLGPEEREILDLLASGRGSRSGQDVF